MFRKILKYEYLNILRNKWVFLYTGLLLGLTSTFFYLAGDVQKAVISLMSVLNILIPLTTFLFSVVYWYHSERFTQALLTQPLDRKHLFLARWVAINSSLGLCLFLGILPLFMIYVGLTPGLLLALILGVFLTIIFATLGIGIAVHMKDRMKGIGMVLGLWLYFSILHDGIILMLLLAFRDYPMDLPSALLSALNPIGISRVALLMYYDISLLLSHSGMLLRNLLTSWKGVSFVLAIGFFWLMMPAYLAYKKFLKADL